HASTLNQPPKASGAQCAWRTRDGHAVKVTRDSQATSAGHRPTKSRGMGTRPQWHMIRSFRWTIDAERGRQTRHGVQLTKRTTGIPPPSQPPGQQSAGAHGHHKTPRDKAARANGRPTVEAAAGAANHGRDVVQDAVG